MCSNIYNFPLSIQLFRKQFSATAACDRFTDVQTGNPDIGEKKFLCFIVKTKRPSELQNLLRNLLPTTIVEDDLIENDRNGRLILQPYLEAFQRHYFTKANQLCERREHCNGLAKFS